ncbi:magnesium transporter CorA family protein [Jatrophihabitans sp.]|uniref:magnesium transporter CorA family protein n=1 Tax=Jatrophihabitans sp. TaxID=1932789 RepID=UPI0030C71D43|nr:Mg2 transporter protein CorA family protein [Jatrophihabitans sp.]
MSSGPDTHAEATAFPGVRTRVWRKGVLERENFPFEEVSDYLEQPDCLVWADLCAPDAATLDQLAEELCLDPHAVEDAGSLHERPKATRYATHLFLSTYALRAGKGADALDMTHVSAFCTKQAFVTVRLDDGFDIEQVVEHWDGNADLMRLGPRALEHGLLDVIVDQYFEAIQSFDEEIDTIEGTLFEDTSGSMKQVQIRAYEVRKALLRARRVVLPMREVVNTVMRRGETGEGAVELAPYFEDLYDHVLRAAEWTESLRDMISSIFDTNMALADSRLNLIMKKLTSWAAIIAVPTAVTGYFGQNVPYPGFDSHWGFVLSVALIVVISAALYLAFKRKEWL